MADQIATNARDAAKYRELTRQLGELLDEGTAATAGLCAMYLAARTHRINAEKAKFRMDGLTLEDGTAIGDWEVTIKRVNPKGKSGG